MVNLNTIISKYNQIDILTILKNNNNTKKIKKTTSRLYSLEIQ